MTSTPSPEFVATPVPLAKLTRPRSDGWLLRTRLFKRLDEAGSMPLVWLCAPPGSGKTSLVASYLESRGRPVAWMQVDEGDADPATFFHYLAGALAALVSRPPPLPLFEAQDATHPARFARRYFRAWFAAAGPQAVLVLDNLQDAG
jgi:hypothetical protein